MFNVPEGSNVSTDDLHHLQVQQGKNSESHRNARRRGYIGMLAVDKMYRGRGIAKNLIERTIDRMVKDGCDEYYVGS